MRGLPSSTALARTGEQHPWLREHPVAVSWPGGAFSSGSLPAGHRLLRDVRECVAHTVGSAPEVRGGPTARTCGTTRQPGIPTLQYGPGDVRHAHASDEQVEVADLERCARVYALLALRRCGTRD